MFDVHWKPADYDEIHKNNRAFGGYHHYCLNPKEDVEGFCEWLRYKGCKDIKVTEHVPYTAETVEIKRNSSILDTDKRNIKLVNKYFTGECYPGNIPYTLRDLMEVIEEMNLDLDKPLIFEADGYYPIENMFVTEEEEDDEINGCLVIGVVI